MARLLSALLASALVAVALADWPVADAEILARSQEPARASNQTTTNSTENHDKCTPILDLPALLNGSHAPAAPTDGSLSFPVADVDLPVAINERSLSGSALRLLGTLSGGGGGGGGDGGAGDEQLATRGAADSEEDPEDPDFENVVRFRDNQLHVTGLNLSQLNVHLFTASEPKFSIGIIIKNTTLTGRFSYRGPLSFTETRLAGFYRMSIDNIFLVASSNLTRSPEQLASPSGDGSGLVDGATSAAAAAAAAAVTAANRSSSAAAEQALSSSLRTNDFRLNVTNLGYIAIHILDSSDAQKPTGNYLLRLLQRLLQKTIKRTYFTFENYIRSTLERESRRSLDCELTRFRLDPLLASDSNQADGLARIVGNEIRRTQLARVALPDFEHQQTVLGTSASIQFRNGSLVGLENIKFHGDTRIKLQDQYLFVNTSIGWRDLTPSYNWSLHLNNKTGSTARGFVSFHIRLVDFDAVITRGLRPPQPMALVVEQLTIKRLDGPKMDIGGLPGMNRVTRTLVNFFMGRMKQRLTAAIQAPLATQFQRSLNKMSLLGGELSR